MSSISHGRAEVLALLPQVRPAEELVLADALGGATSETEGRIANHAALKKPSAFGAGMKIARRTLLKLPWLFPLQKTRERGMLGYLLRKDARNGRTHEQIAKGATAAARLGLL